MSLNSSGKLVTEEVKIFRGDPHEAYALIPPEIGRAPQTGTALSNGTSLTKDPERHALTFFHETRTFAHGMQAIRNGPPDGVLLTKSTKESSPSFPRLEIPPDLPKQTEINKSPATLFLVGVSHTIALDGTFDGI